MRRFWRSSNSTSKRVLDVLEYFLSETVQDYSTVSCSSRVWVWQNAHEIY